MFISYHSGDKDQALSFASTLKSYGLNIWIDIYDIAVGIPSIESLEKALNDANAIAVLIGKSGIGPWQQIEINAAIAKHVSREGLVIPILLPGAPEKPSLPIFLEQFSWVDLRAGFDTDAIEKLKAVSSGIKVQSGKILELYGILKRARKRLVISGHTLDKFSQDIELNVIFTELLSREVKLTIVQLNPHCRYANAHNHYHELESGSSASEQHRKTLEFFRLLFGLLHPSQKANLEVLFTNYMPRYRTIIVDETVYLYFYSYGVDVSTTPDLILEASTQADYDQLRRKVIQSAMKMINSPEVISYIRCSRLIEYWDKSKLVSWDSWTKEERLRHRLTHEFYVTYAQQFHERFGFFLEREVKTHLDLMNGKTLVLGCGSGKEVEYLAQSESRSTVYGLDFSHVAIELAKKRYPAFSAQFLFGDIYDLDHVIDSQLDSIVANAAFVHLYNRDDIDELLHKVYAKLKPGGQFLLRSLYKEKNGKPINSEIDNSSGHLSEWRSARWFVYYSRAELVRRCQNLGFEIMEDTIVKIAREDGFSAKQKKTIKEKGFCHRAHREVYWPTLLARKPL